jgi:hypothetical protein
MPKPRCVVDCSESVKRWVCWRGDEVARAERAQVANQPKLLRQRMLYLASLWQQGASDSVRAVDAAGQALRLTYFPAGLPTSGKSAQASGRAARAAAHARVTR